jgi:hypothetical protein
MKRLIPLLLSLWLLPLACADLPRIEGPARMEAVKPSDSCARIFPQGRWELVHTIEADFPGGRRQLLMGVSRISSTERTVHCVLMTLEGLVLFDARHDGQLAINRAVPPFTGMALAQGMIDDIALLFFAPQSPCREAGFLPNGNYVCRYAVGDGTEDILPMPGMGWEIHRYDAGHNLIRSVTAEIGASPYGERVAERLELNAAGAAEYRLVLTLVEATQLK